MLWGGSGRTLAFSSASSPSICIPSLRSGRQRPLCEANWMIIQSQSVFPICSWLALNTPPPHAAIAMIGTLDWVAVTQANLSVPGTANLPSAAGEPLGKTDWRSGQMFRCPWSLRGHCTPKEPLAACRVKGAGLWNGNLVGPSIQPSRAAQAPWSPLGLSVDRSRAFHVPV